MSRELPQVVHYYRPVRARELREKAAVLRLSAWCIWGLILVWSGFLLFILPRYCETYDDRQGVTPFWDHLGLLPSREGMEAVAGRVVVALLLSLIAPLLFGGIAAAALSRCGNNCRAEAARLEREHEARHGAPCPVGDQTRCRS